MIPCGLAGRYLEVSEPWFKQWQFDRTFSVRRFGRRPKFTRGGVYSAAAASGSDSAGS